MKKMVLFLALFVLISSCFLGCDVPVSDGDDIIAPEPTLGVSAGDKEPQSTIQGTTPEDAEKPSTDAPSDTHTDATTEETVEPTVHLHDFSEATCTDPAICTFCGATEGIALGHNWQEATCTSPKTCTKCQTTKGTAANHHYSEGICTSCGSKDPYYTESTMVWIPTNGGKKYHTHSGCSNMDDPEYVTIEEAEELGFTPCKRCH